MADEPFEQQAKRAILGLAGATTAAADQAQAMTDAELADRLLAGRWTTIEVHEAGRRLARREDGEPREDDDRPELRYIPKADPAAHTPSDSVGTPDVDKLVETMREYVQNCGFEFVVLSDGGTSAVQSQRYTDETLAALTDLAAIVRETLQAFEDQADFGAQQMTRAKAAEADRDRLRERVEELTQRLMK